MAVLDTYVTPKAVASSNAMTALDQNIVKGLTLKIAIVTFELAAGDDDGSIYRVFRNLDGNIRPICILVSNDAITGGTDFDVSVYKAGIGGAVQGATDLLNGTAISLASARAALIQGTSANGLAALAIENIGKKLFELVSHTEATKLPAYDIALTANTVGTAAGTVTMALFYTVD